MNIMAFFGRQKARVARGLSYWSVLNFFMLILLTLKELGWQLRYILIVCTAAIFLIWFTGYIDIKRGVYRSEADTTIFTTEWYKSIKRKLEHIEQTLEKLSEDRTDGN